MTEQEYDTFISTPDPWVGKRVEIHAHFDDWMKGNRFATVLSCEGVQGTTMLYKLQFNSGKVKTYAETNFRLIPGLVQ